jgi:hypothetical protein
MSSEGLNDFFLILDEDVSLIWRDIDIVVVIFHLDVEYEYRVHGRIILFVHL